MKKKWFSFTIRIMFFIFIPLTMAWTCYACETYSFTIVIAAGEGTTEPAPGTYSGYSTWGNEENIKAIPAEGWYVEKIVKQVGLDEWQYTYEEPGIAYILWNPKDDQTHMLFHVYFAKSADSGETSATTTTTTTVTTTSTTVDTKTVNLELLAREYQQSSLDSPSGGGDVTCYADPPYTFPTGSTVKLSCNPKQGYQFERWDIYSKNVDGVFLKTGNSTEVEPTILLDADTKAVAIFRKT